MRRATKWMMALVGVWGVANLLQSFLVCRVHDGHVNLVIDRCRENTASLVSTAVFNCLTNLIIGLLPLYTIWSLVTVSVSTRLGLTCVFVLGVRYVVSVKPPQSTMFSVTRCVTSWVLILIFMCARSVTLVSVYRMYLQAATGIGEDPMVGWFRCEMPPNISLTTFQVAISLVTFLSVLEVTLMIFCNSLPMLLPLYSYWRYRKVFAEDQDEYVSRIRNGSQTPAAPPKSILEGVTNGLPLEMIVSAILRSWSPFLAGYFELLADFLIRSAHVPRRMSLGVFNNLGHC